MRAAHLITRGTRAVVLLTVMLIIWAVAMKEDLTWTQTRMIASKILKKKRKRTKGQSSNRSKVQNNNRN